MLLSLNSKNFGLAGGIYPNVQNIDQKLVLGKWDYLYSNYEN